MASEAEVAQAVAQDVAFRAMVRGKFTRLLVTAAGYLSVGLGVLGAFLPILPTTPFILLAFWLFYRSSPRGRDWLLSRKIFGAIIRNYFENRGIPLHVKILALSMIWLSLSSVALFVVEPLWLKVLMIVIAIGITIHISRYKTLRKKS